MKKDEGVILGIPAQPLENNNAGVAELLPNDLLQEIENPPHVNLNLEVGIMRFQDTRVTDPVFERFTMLVGTPHPPSDLYILWVGISHLLEILKNRLLSPFFTMNLLKRGSFSWAKSFLNFDAYEIIQGEENQQQSLQFSLPFECPNAELECINEYNNDECQTEATTPEHMAASHQPSFSTIVLLPKRRKQRQITLVYSNLRRSLHIKAYNTCFKPPGCRKNIA
jgi:hypothetical protein